MSLCHRVSSNSYFENLCDRPLFMIVRCFLELGVYFKSRYVITIFVDWITCTSFLQCRTSWESDHIWWLRRYMSSSLFHRIRLMTTMKGRCREPILSKCRSMRISEDCVRDFVIDAWHFVSDINLSSYRSSFRHVASKTDDRTFPEYDIPDNKLFRMSYDVDRFMISRL